MSLSNRSFLRHRVGTCSRISRRSGVLPSLSNLPEVFISHCWGRKGFVCSGASAAVELLEVLVENEPLCCTVC